MGVIDESKLNNILPKYDELKLSGKNLAQQYVSAFNTGMNIYQCINQLQGYIEWMIKAVNDVVMQWNETVDSQIKYAINASKQVTTEQFNIEWEKVRHTLETLENSVKEAVKECVNASKQATTEQFNIEWEKVRDTLENNVKLAKEGEDYYVLTENEDKTIKKLSCYIKYNQPYRKGAPHYTTTQYIIDLDLRGYTLKRSMLENNIFKLTSDTSELIDYVYMNLNNVTVNSDLLDNSPYTTIEVEFIPAVTKFTGKEEANGNLDLNTCVTLILEKTSS